MLGTNRFSTSHASAPRLQLLSAVLVVGISVLQAVPAGAADADFETPPVLEASKVLPVAMQRGEHFEVMSEVENDGYMNLYKVASDYGRFDAYGETALAKLIQEIDALTQLDELSRTEVFLDAVKRSALGQVKAIESFAEKPVETVKGIPGGLKRTFRKYKRDAEEGYEVAKDYVTDDDEEETAEGEGEEESSTWDKTKETAEEAGDAAEKYAKKWFGVSGAERRWHADLGTDPYTRNEVLREAVKQVAKVDSTASFGMRFAPIPRIPGASYIRTVNQMVWSMDPRELRDFNIKRLTEAGVDEELIERFMTNPWFSPAKQTLFLTALGEMEETTGRAVALELASEAESAEQAEFDLANILMLNLFHKSESPVTELIRPAPAVVAHAADQRLVLAFSLDYVFWTKLVGQGAAAVTSLLSEEQAATRELWLRGKASLRFEQEMIERGWVVRESVKLEPPPEAEEGGQP